MERQKLLGAIGACRTACLEAHGYAPIQGDIYKGCFAVTESIDGLAGILTGDREYFWLKSAPSPFPPANKLPDR